MSSKRTFGFSTQKQKDKRGTFYVETGLNNWFLCAEGASGNQDEADYILRQARLSVIARRYPKSMTVFVQVAGYYYASLLNPESDNDFVILRFAANAAPDDVYYTVLKILYPILAADITVEISEELMADWLENRITVKRKTKGILNRKIDDLLDSYHAPHWTVEGAVAHITSALGAVIGEIRPPTASEEAHFYGESPLADYQRLGREIAQHRPALEQNTPPYLTAVGVPEAFQHERWNASTWRSEADRRLHAETINPEQYARVLDLCAALERAQAIPPLSNGNPSYGVWGDIQLIENELRSIFREDAPEQTNLGDPPGARVSERVRRLITEALNGSQTEGAFPDMRTFVGYQAAVASRFREYTPEMQEMDRQHWRRITERRTSRQNEESISATRAQALQATIELALRDESYQSLREFALYQFQIATVYPEYREERQLRDRRRWWNLHRDEPVQQFQLTEQDRTIDRADQHFWRETEAQ